jgi:hypothetical protein
LLCNGDITKAETVRWTVTLERANQWADFIWRQKTWWMEALTGSDTLKAAAGRISGNDYCRLCKASGKADCARCPGPVAIDDNADTARAAPRRQSPARKTR